MGGRFNESPNASLSKRDVEVNSLNQYIGEEISILDITIIQTKYIII